MVLSAATALAPAARAQGDDAYCRKVRARATGDAALLMAPLLTVQGIKFPALGQLDLSGTVGGGYQLRGGLTFAPLDFYRGLRLMRLGDADCEQHEVAVQVQQAVSQREEVGKLPALHQQVAWLEGRRAEWERVVTEAEDRLRAQTGSLTELSELRTRAGDLARKLEEARGELERLSLRGFDQPRPALETLARQYEMRADRFEAEASHIRLLDSWELRLTGGAIPLSGASSPSGPSSLDWYGMVELGFNFGAFTRHATESRYLKARQDEVRAARYELGWQLRELRQEIDSHEAQVRRELAAVEQQLSFIATTKAALQQSGAPSAPYALAATTLQEILVGAEEVFLSSLLEELSSLQEASHGS